MSLSWQAALYAIPVGFVWGLTANYLLERKSTWTKVGVAISCYLLAALLVQIAYGATR